MITIIFAPPRTGKTCFMTHMANICAFDRQRNNAMQQELEQKIANGFSALKTIPQHCVSANYDIILRKFRYSPRLSRRINPYRLGFTNSFVKPVHFNFPYEAIFISEAQKYLNSRMSSYFPDWQSRWYEQHGHNNLDIWLDTQRPMLIDVNIRELARFIEIVKLDIKYDRLGQPCRLQWLIRVIPNSQMFDRYMSSGKKDKDCYTEEVITADYNVFRCYDSRACKPMFYAGHFDEDIDYNPAEPTEESLDGYIKFLTDFDDELPDNFYIKRSEKSKP
ncbi:MAG: hypothetical protein K2O44_01530 [Clostridia bacterium]|nr:hypothetical protein [Clostridia bacterium]